LLAWPTPVFVDHDVPFNVDEINTALPPSSAMKAAASPLAIARSPF
jgi:hypothetical protein